MATNKYLHLAVIFKASNLNYGEGVGNILTLKKVTTEGRNYSYISRQALRYDMVRMLEEMHGFKKAKTENIGTKKDIMIQFAKDAKIDEYPEIDLFGYMKTEKKKEKEGKTEEGESGEKTKIRKAVVRLTDAVSLEPFYNELEFGTNKGLADRIEDLNGNNIFQAEIHRSYYCYTITCNLAEIGIDSVYGIDEKIISNIERAERVKRLLNVVKLLYRDIRGKRENLSPLFVIGGLYDVGNPFFYNRIKLSFTKDKILLNEKLINSTLTIKTLEKTVGEQSILGYLDGEFSNIGDIDISEKLSIEDFFGNLSENVDSHYKGK